MRGRRKLFPRTRKSNKIIKTKKTKQSPPKKFIYRKYSKILVIRDNTFILLIIYPKDRGKGPKMSIYSSKIEI